MTSKVTVGANQKCTIQSSGRITVDTPEVENVAVELSAGSTLVNRGTVTATSVPNAQATSTLASRAITITGAGSKLINYGNIYLPKNNARGIDVLTGADNVEIEFLSGSLMATDAEGSYSLFFSTGLNTKLTFGGTALVAVKNGVFYADASGGGDTVILLPGATIHTGDRSRPFSSVTSNLDALFAPDGADVLKIGNFYEGDEPVGDRTGWVHAGQWYFGDPTGGTDELIVDTNPGVRFSNHGGVNHYRSEFSDLNAIYGLDVMDIRRGNVVLGGSVYMPMGKVYVHTPGRLTFEIGKRREEDSRKGEMIISRLVAKELIFSSQAMVFIQFAHYLDASDIERFRTQLVPKNLSQLDAATLSLDGAGNELSKILKVEKVSYLADFQKAKNPPEDPVDITDYVSHMKVMSSGPSGIQLVGHIIVKSGNNADIGKLVLFDKETNRNIGQLRFSSVSTTSTGGTGTGGIGGGGTGTGGTGTGGGGGGGILIVGLLAALMGAQDLDESESELGQYYSFDRKPAKNRSHRSSFFSGLFRPERGMWVRPAESRFTSFGASYFGAVSHRMSWNLQQSGDYFLRANLTPATSVSPTGWHSSASGETISLTGGWQRDDRRVQFGISHGRYDANAKMYDSATEGNLFGESKFRHTSVHASAVQELSGRTDEGVGGCGADGRSGRTGGV